MVFRDFRLTQRGNENFGAVLDSIGAIVVQEAAGVYLHNSVDTKIRGNRGTAKIKEGHGVDRQGCQDYQARLGQNRYL